MLSLHFKEPVKDYHALIDIDSVLFEFTALSVASQDIECTLHCH
jgi:hypothetical protein